MTDLDAKTDLYSACGATIYHLLAGKPMCSMALTSRW